MILSQLLALFWIIFKLELEHDISNVHAKSMRVSFLRYEEIRTKIQVLLLSKLSSLCKHAWHIKFFPCCWSSVVNLNSQQFCATRMALLLQFFRVKLSSACRLVLERLLCDLIAQS